MGLILGVWICLIAIVGIWIKDIVSMWFGNVEMSSSMPIAAKIYLTASFFVAMVVFIWAIFR